MSRASISLFWNSIANWKLRSAHSQLAKIHCDSSGRDNKAASRRCLTFVKLKNWSIRRLKPSRIPSVWSSKLRIRSVCCSATIRLRYNVVVPSRNRRSCPRCRLVFHRRYSSAVPTYAPLKKTSSHKRRWCLRLRRHSFRALVWRVY